MALSKAHFHYGIEDAIRPAREVMKPERIGAFRMTSLSFARIILRRAMREKWSIDQHRFNLDHNGHGEAIYYIRTPAGTFSFVVVSQDIDEYERSDRVISEKWDITFALCEGVLSEEKIEDLKRELPKQELGRGTVQDLVWSRANRSSRIFQHIVNALTSEQQPDPEALAKVGYIVRSTAFYANGKFGVAPFEKMKGDHPLHGAFSAQLFTAYMLRQFSFDIVEHIAKCQNPQASTLDDRIKRFLGIGNATGLGMVPFLIYHPKLIHQWIYLRELSLARSKVEPMTEEKINSLIDWLDRAIHYFAHYPVQKTGVFEDGESIAGDLQIVRQHLEDFIHSDHVPEDTQWLPIIEQISSALSVEAQEVLNTMMIEIYPEKNEELEQYTVVNEEMELNPSMTIGELLGLINNHYQWVFSFDFSNPDEKYYFWYRSVDKEEPRIAVRGEEPGDEHEMPMNIAELVQKVSFLLQDRDYTEKVATFVFRYPEYKGIIRRIQSLENYDYGEIRGNLLDKNMVPIFLMRCKLSFFGGERFDPKSNRWVRITLFQGAPLIKDFTAINQPKWIFPKIPKLEG
ncbi:hypothetical protein GLW08_18420 [Pontibacillus yanchengensis]|uniref:Uncharacterized protein n=2 Tax=Pontibacillus yanchengensis TaxID=462910 RepID=A0ACC7VK12_9BACI|nr:hypothetical protein [Pontibacillus yanchengensis]MYL34987.1 hypothetical protein [Pontibacillus yanchengensis]MYL55301.1 hypothetical protein [Pontibacillus yanchengensis]